MMHESKLLCESLRSLMASDEERQQRVLEEVAAQAKEGNRSDLGGIVAEIAEYLDLDVSAVRNTYQRGHRD